MNETQKDELIYEYHKNNMAKLIRLCQPILIKMGGISRKDYEDFYEIASDVVMSSVNTYDDSKSSFHTYITGNITRKFKTELRDRNRKKRIPAKQMISIHMETDDGLSLEDTIPFSSAADSSVLQEVVPTHMTLPPFFLVMFIISAASADI